MALEITSLQEVIGHGIFKNIVLQRSSVAVSIHFLDDSVSIQLLDDEPLS